jgi:hypothetical protein
MKNLKMYCYLSLLVYGSIYSQRVEITDELLIPADPQAALTKQLDSGALVLIETQTVSLATALTFTRGITSTYNNYLLYVTNLTFPEGNGQSLLMQISTDGGNTYINSGYQGAGGTALDIFDFVFDPSENGTGQILLNNFTSNAGYITSYSNLVTAYSGGVFVNSVSDGINDATYLVNAFNIFTSDGSPFSGVFSLYGFTQ